MLATGKQGAAPPHLPQWDSTLPWLRDPYRFIARASRMQGSDVLEGRLMLRPTTFMTGAPAAELFYDAGRFEREGAAPAAVQATLFGKGGVQGLDGAAHRHRKALFMHVTAPGRVEALVAQARAEWPRCLARWSGTGTFSLYDAAQDWLTRSVCAWAGVPLPADAAPRRTRQLAALFDAAASGPLQHLRSRLARWQAERWLMQVIADARQGRLALPSDGAAHAVAWHRDEAGLLLSTRIAAVELLNVLRPTVAVSLFIVFTAHALHRHAGARAQVQGGGPREHHALVQEVRRHYPFFPVLAARVRHDFAWQGWHFPQGRRVVLDIYGTNHDARLWADADRFRPERFLQREPGRFDFIPQGGAEAATGHRCPGEGIAVALMECAADLLVNRAAYTVPPQALDLNMRRLPALPRDRFMIAGVQLRD